MKRHGDNLPFEPWLIPVAILVMAIIAKGITG